jgi:hypothetical protein
MMKRLLTLLPVITLAIGIFFSPLALASPYGCGAYGSEAYQTGVCGTTTTTPPSGGGGTTGGSTASGDTTSGGTASGPGSSSKKTTNTTSNSSTGNDTTPTEETAVPGEGSTTPTEEEPTITIGPVKLPANEKIAVANKKLPVTGVQALGVLGIVLVATAIGMLIWYYRRKHKDDPSGPGSGGTPPTILIPPSNTGGGTSGPVGPNIGY